MKDFITEPATKFNFNPSEFVPFKDREVCERVRKMSGKELEKREDWWHPEFNVKVMPSEGCLRGGQDLHHDPRQSRA